MSFDLRKTANNISKKYGDGKVTLTEGDGFKGKGKYSDRVVGFEYRPEPREACEVGELLITIKETYLVIAGDGLSGYDAGTGLTLELRNKEDFKAIADVLLETLVEDE